ARQSAARAETSSPDTTTISSGAGDHVRADSSSAPTAPASRHTGTITETSSSPDPAAIAAPPPGSRAPAEPGLQQPLAAGRELRAAILVGGLAQEFRARRIGQDRLAEVADPDTERDRDRDRRDEGARVAADDRRADDPVAARRR